ncbi:MAG: hypothetical protein GYA60_08100, partial [Candidatus Methanofastidiosa archaeon]|nr:hypothetical protein [Candidatus Methanofastidiosa archaeon]
EISVVIGGSSPTPTATATATLKNTPTPTPSPGVSSVPTFVTTNEQTPEPEATANTETAESSPVMDIRIILGLSIIGAGILLVFVLFIVQRINKKKEIPPIHINTGVNTNDNFQTPQVQEPTIQQPIDQTQAEDYWKPPQNNSDQDNPTGYNNM